MLALVIAGASLTVSAKACVALAPMPLVAVSVTLWTPPVPAAGVPLSRPALDNVTPAGSVPAVTLTVGAGKPVITTVKEPAAPRGKVVLFALVIAGGALTTTVKACVAFGSVPLVAVSVTGNDPLCVGVPDSNPAADSVRPVGNTPLVTLTVGAGLPVITTWNVVPAVFSRNVAVLALVIAGA